MSICNRNPIVKKLIAGICVNYGHKMATYKIYIGNKPMLTLFLISMQCELHWKFLSPRELPVKVIGVTQESFRDRSFQAFAYTTE